MPRTAIVFSMILFAGSFAQAHDYWMQPDSFSLESGESTMVHLFVGDHFVSESERPYQAKMTVKFQLIGHGSKADLARTAKDGERPAGRIQAKRAGGHLVAMERDWAHIEIEAAKFNSYLEHEGLGRIVKVRKDAGEDKTAGRERYRRYLKALVQVDSKRDEVFKRKLGHRLEIVPQTDPSASSTKQVTVSILFDGKPLADAMVAALNRKGEDVKTKELRTDKNGQVRFQLNRSGVWLIRLVHMQRCKHRDDIDWESFWAAYSFERK
jgi:uncharacterized GH25 family protein